MRAILLSLLAGCSAGDLVIDETFDACAPLVLDAADADPDQRAGIADAVASWQARGVGLQIVVDGASPGAASIPVVFQDANPTFHGYYDDELGVIYVNRALDADPAARAIAIAHELGHAFGLYHVDVDERESLMNPHNLTVAPTEEDRVEVELLWGACAP